MLPAAIGILTLATLYAVFFLVPPAVGLGNLVRIAFFHIPMAWVAVVAFLMSAWWGGRYLKTRNPESDVKSARSAAIGLVFTLLATISGSIFSKLTWGAYWNWDPRQTTIFILLLIYGAYLTLRLSMADEEKRAAASAVYAIFSFLAVPFLVFILPRLFFSLHPTPVINSSGKIDMDSVMLFTLLAAVVDATLIYIWLLRRGKTYKEVRS